MIDSIGKRISYIRKKRGYSQNKLAELSGISVQFLSDIENNKKSMTVKTLRQIADNLNISTDYIIYGREKPIENTTIDIMLNSLSNKNKNYAEKLLCIFIDAINDKSE